MYELFLILDAFGDRSQLITYLLEPLTSFVGRPAVVRAHYREDIDVALVSLAFDADSADHVSRFRELAQRAGIKVIDPAGLDTDARATFYGTQLAAYPVVIETPELGAALAELNARVTPARRRRDETVDLGPTRPPPPPSSAGLYRRGRARDRGADMTTRVGGSPTPLVSGARGTRDKIEPPDLMHHRPVTPARAERTDDTTAPQLAPEGNRISVKVSRGDNWVPGRLRFLSVRRVEVAVSAAPQVGDPIRLALGFRDREVHLDGIVDRVNRAPNLETPVSTGFSASLSTLGEAAKRDLIDLLRRASEAGVRLAPPALRPARFSVSWPLIVRPANGEPLRVTALDISLGGMFLQHPDLAGELDFVLPIDEPGSAIRGRLEVVREVRGEEAERLGFAPGSGVALRRFAVRDRERYNRLVDRIRARNNRRLVVAAAPDRLEALATNLRGVGYAVTSSADPAEVVDLASGRLRPDVAIVDHSLTGLASETELLLTILREHHLFTLATAGENAEETRRAVDELLGI